MGCQKGYREGAGCKCYIFINFGNVCNKIQEFVWVYKSFKNGSPQGYENICGGFLLLGMCNQRDLK